jgi:hypothetical protein
MSGTSISEVIDWPSARDVSRSLDISVPYVYLLIRSGRLATVQTRLGQLVNPESVAAFEAARRARKVARACTDSTRTG